MVHLCILLFQVPLSETRVSKIWNHSQYMYQKNFTGVISSAGSSKGCHFQILVFKRMKNNEVTKNTTHCSRLFMSNTKNTKNDL